MTDEGYKPVFDEALRQSKEIDYASTFSDFHNNVDLFHFIMAPHHMWASDEGALREAKALNPEIYQTLYDKGPSTVGNGSEMLDHVESRHILLMTNLIGLIGTDWGSVVEVGGGYGNQLRLVSDIVTYNHWAYVDMGYILDLQKWFLLETGVDIERVHFLNSENETYFVNIDLVIGTHSLSEFSLFDFQMYYDNLISNVKWFYYASHRTKPDATLLQRKLDIIQRDFTIYDERDYEGGSSVMYLFRNKND